MHGAGSNDRQQNPRTQWSAIPYFTVTVAVNRKGP